MITDNYIKMCEQAKMIQELWRNPFRAKYGDMYWKGDKYLMIPSACELCIVSNFIPEDEIWLPTQEQLQEILGNPLVNLDGTLRRLATMFLISNDYISWNEFWLMVVMHEKYNKVWTGDKWEGGKGMSIEQFEEDKKAFLEFEATFKAQITKLTNRIKALEQKDSYYPTEEEIPYIKVGLTD